MNAGAYAYIWLIPLLPGLGALVNGVLGKKLPKPAVSVVACGSVLLSFLISVAAVWQLRGEETLGTPGEVRRYEGVSTVEVVPSERRVEATLYRWIGAGAFKTLQGTYAPMNVDVAYQLDPLSAIMLMVVCGVGFLIHVYSVGYMGHEPGYARYFCYLNLFMFSMLNLVLGNNFLVMFVGWEGVGLCSYLLIGYYYDKDFAATAGKKAFVTNRIGDFGFVLGMMTVFYVFGTIDFSDVMAMATEPGAFRPGDTIMTAIALCLFLGACGKSAQIPLYVWLPDAMAGPTPVSALIHAATMVTSGIYMIVRCNPIYQLAPIAMATVAIVAAATAIMAASIGLVQNDIKKVLAYSTVSQLGYMFLALGVGAFTAGIFHLMTHAFFKALLFLGSGSVIHAMSGEQDIRKMGGLKDKIPWTRLTFLVGCLAIAGIPGLSGFFSKDEILWKSYSSPVLPELGKYLWAVAVVTAGMTAFYMFRLYWMTFGGKCRADEETQKHIHESPATMVVPLVLLALLSIGGGWIGIPHSISSIFVKADINKFEHWLRPVIWRPGEVAGAEHGGGHGAPAQHGAVGGGEQEAHGAGGREIHEHEVPMVEYVLMIGTSLFGLVSIGVAYKLYIVSPEIPPLIAAKAGALYRLLLEKYYVDEIYEVIVIRHMKMWCSVLAWFDLAIIDGVVNGVSAVTRGVADLSRLFDTYVVDGLVNFVGFVCEEGSYVFRRTQTGYVQNYMFLTIFAVLGMLGIYLLRAFQYGM